MGKEIVRELFVDELATVTGGKDCPDCHSTMACCEEGPDGCCNWYGLGDIISWG